MSHPVSRNLIYLPYSISFLLPLPSSLLSSISFSTSVFPSPFPANSAEHYTELCLRMEAALILPSQLSHWPGRIYSGDVSTWHEGSLSSFLSYLPEVAVAHFKASTNPSYSSSILSFPPTPPSLNLRSSPRHPLKSSSAHLSASSAFKIQ